MNLTWIKLAIDILDDAKIKIIRSHPDGNSIVVLWIGLLCLAMKSARPGIIEISDGIPYTIDDLSNAFSIEKKTVELGLTLFAKYRMIDLFDGNTIEVINFSKHQNLERIEEKRQLNRERVKLFREKQKCNALLTHTTCNVTLTDKNKKENKNKTKNKKENRNIYSENSQKVISYLNKKTGKNYSDISQIDARLKEGKSFDDCIKIIDNKLSDQFFTENPKHLNPVTLFRKSHFDTYLNDEPNPLAGKVSDKTIRNIETFNNWRPPQ